MPLSDDAAAVAQLSATDLDRCIALDGYKTMEVHQLPDVTIDVYRGKDDTATEQKVVALRTAIVKIRRKGIALPARMKLYTSSRKDYQNIAFQRNTRGDREAVVCLGGKLTTPTALPIGVATVVSAMGSNISEFITAVCVHELGHVLHEIADGEYFWSKEANETPPGKLAGLISMYAAANKKEFVAEVFTGCIYGKKTEYGQGVMDAYDTFHGPAGL
jgi:hypothetical protein